MATHNDSLIRRLSEHSGNLEISISVSDVDSEYPYERFESIHINEIFVSGNQLVIAVDAKSNKDKSK